MLAAVHILTSDELPRPCRQSIPCSSPDVVVGSGRKLPRVFVQVWNSLVQTVAQLDGTFIHLIFGLNLFGALYAEPEGIRVIRK